MELHELLSARSSPTCKECYQNHFIIEGFEAYPFSQDWLSIYQFAFNLVREVPGLSSFDVGNRKNNYIHQCNNNENF
jgi:hypothetical protein